MRFGLEKGASPRRVKVLESLRALKRSIVVCVCVALPLVLAGASLAGKTPAKKAPHRPPVRHSPKQVAGIALKPKFEAEHGPRQVPQALERRGDRSRRSTTRRCAASPAASRSCSCSAARRSPRRSRSTTAGADVAYAEPNYLLHAAALRPRRTTPSTRSASRVRSTRSTPPPGGASSPARTRRWLPHRRSPSSTAASPRATRTSPAGCSREGADCTTTPPTCVAATAPGRRQQRQARHRGGRHRRCGDEQRPRHRGRRLLVAADVGARPRRRTTPPRSRRRPPASRGPPTTARR